jgi:hypothetical protein
VTEITPARRVGLVLAGLVGAWLTSLVHRSENPLHAVNGIWFGAAMATYFALVSVEPLAVLAGRSLGLVLLSSVGWWLASLTGFILEVPFLDVTLGGGYSYHPPNVVALFVGGAVGGLMMSAATFVLYINRRRRTKSALLIGAIAGGILAIVGMALSDERWHSGSSPFKTLYYVWQPGMALVIAVIWPVDSVADDAADSADLDQREASQ